MIQSIRTFLIINLLLSVTLIISLAIIGNLFLEHRKMEKRLDTQLVYTALRIEAFMSSSSPLSLDEIQQLQNNIDSIPQRSAAILPYHHDDNEVQKNINPQFQIWHQNQLLLKSHDLPSATLAGIQNGFMTKKLEGTQWRIFTTHLPKSKITVVVAENYDLQERLENRITESSVLMMLMSYPLLGLLIWAIVGRGLNSIGHVTHEIKHRDPSFLEPLTINTVPIEIKPFVDELNTLFETLQATLEREKRFASDAAHELLTPLAVLRTQAQIAANAQSNQEKDQAVAAFIKSIDRSTHIVQQLLTLCRMGPEANLEAKSPVDLVKSASEVIAELFPQAIKNHTEIELHPQQEHMIVPGHATGIHMLFRNLIDNAIKYTPKHSLIHVFIEQQGPHTAVRVVDNGKGMPKAARQRAFERFFRGLGEESPGCGLGLGIVQQVVQSHDAQITLKTPDSGTGLEVVVIFPDSKIN
jgi:two-component system, OmpR family, sensor histidine kinase QseC